jgi:orotidine-5'-phosphate decarboxylase
MDFFEKLAGAIKRNRSLLCVGLDPDPARMPEGINIFEFNKAVIDATAGFVCAYKPNIAFYEALGSEGLEALKDTRDAIPGDIPVIIDAKRNDIGNTARAYARGLFDYYNFDAATVNPYLGYDSLEPFLLYRERGVFVLCRTSNKGAMDFQSLSVGDDSGRSLFEVVASKVNEWNEYGNLGLVVGATYPEELKLMRERYPEMPFLIPGVGTQGGDLAKVVPGGVDAGRKRTVINCSRQILYASRDQGFARAAGQAARELRDKINECLGKP